jgi:hypothetical protein
MVCAICYQCVLYLYISKSNCALGIRVLATLYYNTSLHFWERVVRKRSDTRKSVFITYIYRDTFSSYLFSINGVKIKVNPITGQPVPRWGVEV